MKQQETFLVKIFLGDDTKRSHEALLRAVDEVKIKNPNALVSRFDDISFDPTFLREALESQSMFGGGNIIVIDGILDHAGGEEFYRIFQGWKDVTNFVFIRERSPAKEIRTLFGMVGVVEEFAVKKFEEKKKSFTLANAVAMRDKRSAWVEFAKEIRSGAVAEEVHGMIFWAMKALYICATQTKEEAMRAGVKEFTYITYQPRTKNFLLRELEEKLGELKDIYHRAHHGDGDLGIFLEQFLLKL